ncbi:MAG: glycosyltransferase family 2 protein [Ferruginibacter sp.]
MNEHKTKENQTPLQGMGANAPFISLCIPTYKRTALLKKLLNSIVQQSFKDFEILINDNSPDDSVKELLTEYKILPISYEKNIPALTAVENAVKVIRRANSDWIKIIHDDDWFATDDALQLFADAASTSGKDFIFCASNLVSLETGKVEPQSLSEKNKNALQETALSLFFLNTIGPPSLVMFKKDTAIEFDKQYNWVLDIDFYMRYLNVHPGFHYINKALVNIGKSEGQESYKYHKNGKVEIPEYFSMLSKYESDLVLKNIYVFHLVWNMLQRYQIKSIAQFKDFGYQGLLPDKIDAIIAFQKKIPRIILKQPKWSEKLMRRCFSKLASGG